MIAQTFIDEYVKLNEERDGGLVIWQLCKMSAEVIENGSYGDGATAELAQAAGISVDTIEYRRFAWRGLVEFRNSSEFANLDTGEITATDHLKILNGLRQRYSYFATAGRYLCKGKLNGSELTGWMEKAARERWSVQQLRTRLKEIHGKTPETPNLIRRFQSQAAEILAHGEELRTMGMAHITAAARQAVQPGSDQDPITPLPVLDPAVQDLVAAAMALVTTYNREGIFSPDLLINLAQALADLMQNQELQADMSWLQQPQNVV